ncbi:STAS domain-containing protein [Streptomyces sp. NPDC046161]|uniref:STAS domain-containing protein n=1 Tax=Streptomyces sp. NPDC046161 TaxID=3155132 RepID=UPI0033F8AA12
MRGVIGCCLARDLTVLVLDVHALETCDEAGLHVLTGASAGCTAMGGSVYLAAPTSRLRAMVTAGGLERFFRCTTTWRRPCEPSRHRRPARRQRRGRRRIAARTAGLCPRVEPVCCSLRQSGASVLSSRQQRRGGEEMGADAGNGRHRQRGS